MVTILKNFSSLIFLLCALTNLPAQKIQFDGVTYHQAYEASSDTETVREFIPKGEKLDAWVRLVSIREYRGIDDPKALALSLEKVLKEQNPGAPSSVIQNPKTGEALVDFVTWPKDNAFVEFNIFKYAKAPSGGVVAEQFAWRQYGDVSEFLRNLKKERPRLVDLMAKEGLKRQK